MSPQPTTQNIDPYLHFQTTISSPRVACALDNASLNVNQGSILGFIEKENIGPHIVAS